MKYICKLNLLNLSYLKNNFLISDDLYYYFYILYLLKMKKKNINNKIYKK